MKETSRSTTLMINSLDNIDDAAALFVAAMGNNKVFAFRGLMGVGKTTFVKAICRQLGVKDAINSPTFAIINEYDSDRGSIYHFDFYRINSPEEAFDFGYEDYFFGDNICFIEWPELVQDLLPSNVVNVSIVEDSDGSRMVTMGNTPLK